MTKTNLFWRLIVIVVAANLSACATYTTQASAVQNALIQNQLDLALTLLDKKEGSTDGVLTHLNKGMLLQMKGDFAASNASFEIAKKKIEKLHGFSVTEQLSSVIVNDAVVAYQGARHEQLLLHAYMALNYIQLNQLDAARVEMLQADIKMREWGNQPDDDPFIRYLSGMIFEALGESDQALVAYRHALDAYKANVERQQIGTPDILKRDILRLLYQLDLSDEYERYLSDFKLPNSKQIQNNEKQGELIVILSNGLAPIKYENSITVFSNEIEKMIRIAVPTYSLQNKPLNVARIVINGKTEQLVTVENVDSLARSELQNEMPSIITRAIARAVIKRKTQNQANNNNAMSGLLMTVTNLVTERADARSWVTLPQEIQLSRQFLNAGKYDINLEILNYMGTVTDSFNETVTILPGKITFVFKYWVSPRLVYLNSLLEKDKSRHGVLMPNAVINLSN